MNQHNKMTNWVLQDPNGQSQMIKVVQAGGKQIGSLMTSSISGQTIKIIKSQLSDEEGSQVIAASGSQMLKIGNGSKLLTKVPLNSIRYSCGPDGQLVPKTIRLAPSQMKNLKLVTNPQKLQSFQPITQSTLLTPPPLVPKLEAKYIISPPILDHTGNRKRQDLVDADYAPEYKRKKTEKVGKGLRHFSMKVCEKVRRKGTTSYNEVADELVEEFTSALNNSATDQQYDQKNIRRRVYDALNVLMAMNIISKEKKEIRWLGLPTNSVQECIQLEREKQSRLQSIKEKTKKLESLVLNQIAFKNLALRNRNMEMEYGPPHQNSFIELPFIIINTNRKTCVDCSISNDKMEYMFQFSDKFQIHDDSYVLREIGMLLGIDRGECSAENLEKIKTLVPKILEDYVVQLANKPPDLLEDSVDLSSSPGPSSLLSSDQDLGEEENSFQSSNFDPLSPKDHDFSDDDGDMSDLSSDIDTN